MKKRRRLVWGVVAVLLAGAGIADAVRYLQPAEKEKTTVQPTVSFTPKELTLVYNANGGIYPGIVDFAHKLLSPSIYPCHLCYLTYGTFTMKREWKDFLKTLPQKKTFLHRDGFKRQFEPDDLPLPVILATNGKETSILISAEEINQLKTLDELKRLVQSKLTP